MVIIFQVQKHFSLFRAANSKMTVQKGCETGGCIIQTAVVLQNEVFHPKIQE